MANSSAGSQRHILGIQVSRGIAAILVILQHVSHHIEAAYGTDSAPLLTSAFRFGHAGVDLFFVISGFIILYVHYEDVGNPKQIARYVRRRLTRILPTYWAAFALTLAMAMFGTHSLPSIIDLAWSGFLLPSDKTMLVGVAWTLRFEMLFYALFCFVILSRKGVVVLALWGVVCALCTLFGTRLAFLPEQFQSAFALQFFFGMAVAYLAKEFPVRRPYAILTTGLLLFTSFAVLENLQIVDGHADYARFAYGIPSALIILGIVTRPSTTRSAAPYILRIFGDASYSIYIFQYVLIGPVWQVLLWSGIAKVSAPFEQYIILCSVAIFGGVLMSKLVEEPLIRVSRAWISSNKSKHPSPQRYARPT